MTSTSFLGSAKKQVDACNSCAELQRVAQDAIGALNAQSKVVSDQLDKLKPIKDLLDPPATHDDVVNWAKGLIDNVLKPLYAPVGPLLQQQAQLPIDIAELTSAITTKAQQFSDCSVGGIP